METKTTRLCIVTMIGPFDLIGDLVTTGDGSAGFCTLKRPFMIHPQQSGITLRDMTRGSPVIEGDSIVINMANVLWISEPTSSLRSAYLTGRAGLVRGATNNVHVGQPMQ